MAAQVIHRKKKHQSTNIPNEIKIEKSNSPNNPDNIQTSNLKANSWFIIILLLITFATYLPSLNNQFTNWDDRPYVTENPLIKELNWQAVKEIFASKNLSHRYWMGNYHPLSILTLAVNYHMSGADKGPKPWIFILTNILLHVINTLLVFLIILRLSKKEWLAFAVALLFGIHTLHVESVSWISERKDVLYTLFYLWALLTYLGYLKKRKTGLYLWSLLLFVLSLLSKGQAVSLALTVVLMDIFYRRRLLSAQVIIEKIPYFILALAFGLIAIEAQKYSSALQVDEVYALYKRIGIASYGFGMYILKMILPVHLSAIYPYPDILNKTIPFYYYLFAIPDLLLLYLAYIWYRKGHDLAALGIAFFVVNIIFLLQLIPVGSAIYADRYSYIPSIGFFLTIAYLWDRFREKKKNLAFATLAIYFLLLITLTISRQRVWHDSISLWSDTTSKTPKAVVAWNNLGSSKSKLAKDSLEAGNRKAAIKLYSEAVEHFSRAIDRKPDYANAFYNRGTARFELARITKDTSLINKALEDLNKAIAIKVDFTEAFIERGIVYDFINDLEKAFINYKRVLMLSPNNTKALINIGIYYGKKGMLDSAIAYFNRALKVQPELPEAYINRGLAYTLKGNYEQALSDLNQAIELDPNKPAAYINRSLTYQNMKQFDKAIINIDKAIEIMPSNPEFYFKKAVLLEQIGNLQEACLYYQKAANFHYQPAIQALRQKCKK